IPPHVRCDARGARAGCDARVPREVRRETFQVRVASEHCWPTCACPASHGGEGRGTRWMRLGSAGGGTGGAAVRYGQGGGHAVRVTISARTLKRRLHDVTSTAHDCIPIYPE